MSRPALPGFALSAGMLWLLAGAIYKLFEGSPMDLPELVRENSPFDAWGTMRSAVAIELAIVALVIALPRLGWFVLAGAYATFVGILGVMISEGVTSCGCFGGKIEISPTTMIAIDGTLLLLILFSRPWRMPKESGLGGAAFLALAAGAIAAPTLKLTPPELPTVNRGDSEVVGNGDGNATATPAVDGDSEVDPSAADTGTQEPEATDPNATGSTDEATTEPSSDVNDAPAVEDPLQMPEFVEFKFDQWEGKDFFETEAGLMSQYATDGAVMPGSHVVVYRRTCEVCKEHLEALMAEAQNDPNHLGGKQLVLLRLEEAKDATAENLVALPEQMLPAITVTLPALARGYGVTTPMSFDVNDAYQVENVVDVRKLLGH